MTKLCFWEPRNRLWSYSFASSHQTMSGILRLFPSLPLIPGNISFMCPGSFWEQPEDKNCFLLRLWTLKEGTDSQRDNVSFIRLGVTWKRSQVSYFFHSFLSPRKKKSYLLINIPERNKIPHG